MTNEMPAIVMAAGVFLEHCRYVQYPTDREYSAAVELSPKEAKVHAAALEVMRLYFTEERAYNDLVFDDDLLDEQGSGPWLPVKVTDDPIVLVEEKERDERPTDQPRLED